MTTRLRLRSQVSITRSHQGAAQGTSKPDVIDDGELIEANTQTRPDLGNADGCEMAFLGS